jgi:hypothetical protein
MPLNVGLGELGLLKKLLGLQLYTMPTPVSLVALPITVLLFTHIVLSVPANGLLTMGVIVMLSCAWQR